MRDFLGLVGICVGTYLVFITLDKVAQHKEKEEHDYYEDDKDGDCPHDCCGCHGCCHEDDDEK